MRFFSQLGTKIRSIAVAAEIFENRVSNLVVLIENEVSDQLIVPDDEKSSKNGADVR